VEGQTPLVAAGGGRAEVAGLPLGPKDEVAVFLRIDPPAKARAGSAWEFDVQQFSGGTRKRTLLGGSRYRVVMSRKAR
jgi:hypothetical protein